MKKRMISIFSILAVVATLLLSGCNGNTEDLSNSKYVGTWKAVSMELGGESEGLSADYSITLKPDGTTEFISDEGTTTGTWKLTDNGFKTSGETKLSFTDDGDDIVGKVIGVTLRFKRVDEQSGEVIGMPNPWTEDESPEAAAQAAVVGYFDLPENGTDFEGGRLDWTTYRHMDSLAEADGDIGAATIVVRKGLKQNSDDVSGDYTEYAQEWTKEIDFFTVKCYGQVENKTMKAVWLSDNFSYSIVIRGQGDDAETYGISENDLENLVLAIQ